MWVEAFQASGCAGDRTGELLVPRICQHKFGEIAGGQNRSPQEELVLDGTNQRIEWVKPTVMR
ncbi:hypothetical protein [Rhodococcus kronopolitis]|uniref:Uncharacterized protein n=1 Tax=Rhodococcus kronopolitis TaxID=1460226 RepID=A0ABV9FK49_9NOCA